MKYHYIFTSLLIIATLSGCKGGNTGGSTPTPPSTPDPTPGTETPVPEWNKDRTLELLVITNHRETPLYNSKNEYLKLADQLKEKSSYSIALLMNTNAVSDGSLPAMVIPPAVNLFHCYNLTDYRDGISKGNLILTKEYTRDYTNHPIGHSYLLTLTTDLKTTSLKQISYKIPLGVISIPDRETLDALVKALPDFISDNNEIFLIGMIDKDLVTDFPKADGYELTEVASEKEGAQALFLFAKRSYLHRETETLFTDGEVTGYSVKVEGGIRSYPREEV